MIAVSTQKKPRRNGTKAFVVPPKFKGNAPLLVLFNAEVRSGFPERLRVSTCQIPESSHQPLSL